jgi:hypothetical protein
MQWRTTATVVTCCTPWGSSLGYVNHTGYQYPLKGAVWTGEGHSIRGFRFRGLTLEPHIPIDSVSGSPVLGVLENKLVTLGGGGGAPYPDVL